MSDIENRIKELSDKINSLQHKQRETDNELRLLQIELLHLKLTVRADPSIITDKEITTASSPIIEHSKTFTELPKKITAQNIIRQPQKTFHSNQELEDFIGTNLISKVGIVITIIGIFIGAKYAIDKNLISATMRIILGYLAGAGLITTAIVLKRKYENFSAVLMGGGLAVLYFITYIAYGFYQLFPQAVSFLLMVAITTAAVFIALWYNKKIIAILGQVGAYAIPFLLSNESGKVLILFSYISIINVGLLILSLRKDWKILYRIAFFLTWLIYASWLAFKKPELQQESIGFIFLFINFFTFYFTFLFYKVIKKELYNLVEIAVLLLNALLFFFFGYYLISDVFTSSHALTYFTIVNAAIHFFLAYIIYTLKLSDKTVHQFITGLGILFITVAIPVELNGSWVTLLWSIEATVLCWIALKNSRRLYLVLTLPMVIIAAFSLLQDWTINYPHLRNYVWIEANNISPFLNITFWFSLCVSLCFGYISFLSFKNATVTGTLLEVFFKTIMPVLFFVILYFTIFNEIHIAWDNIIKPGYTTTGADDSRIYLREICLMIYSFLYAALFLKLNSQYIKSSSATQFLMIVSILCAAIFLFQGLNTLGEIRKDYLGNDLALILGFRYLTFLSLAVLILACRSAIDILSNKKEVYKIFSLSFNILLLAVICSEFVNWMDIAGYQNQYRLGLTIICGMYALVLIIAGIKNRTKYLRIAAIILFGVTLLKLFFYDLADLSTVSKTIVLVILGVLLLVISFLYNKYKAIIFSEDDKEIESNSVLE